MLIAGIDDAGRGPVIGPLVIAGVSFNNYQIPRLLQLGVKDSKVLTAKRRYVLSQEVKKLAVQWEVLEISPSEVDKIVLEGKKYHSLNWLEAIVMAEIIKKLHPDVAYVDASDINETRFAQMIKEVLPFEVEIISEHHADSNYLVVSAASIIAKVSRDEAVTLLRQRYGDFGSGYSSDPKTRQFLMHLIKEGEEIPHFVRKSWKTIKQLSEQE